MRVGAMGATMDVFDVDGEEGIRDSGVESPPWEEEVNQEGANEWHEQVVAESSESSKGFRWSQLTIFVPTIPFWKSEREYFELTCQRSHNAFGGRFEVAALGPSDGTPSPLAL
jgi:hypothetical protein